MQRREEPSRKPFRQSRALGSPDLGGRCLLDSYRLVRRIQSGCELTREMCRRQRKMIEEQREFLKGLRQVFLSDSSGVVQAGDESGRGFDGGARAVE